MPNLNQAAADAERIAANRKKAESLSRALHAFEAAPRSKAQEVPATRSSNGIQSIMGGAMLSSFEPTPKATVRKADTLPIHSKVAPLQLPTEQAALLSFVVKEDELSKGRFLVPVSRSSAGEMLGVTPDQGEAAINALVARQLIVYRDNGSGERGFTLSPKLRS
jgi:hypothetical protein